MTMQMEPSDGRQTMAFLLFISQRLYQIRP